MKKTNTNQDAARVAGRKTHVRYLQPVLFFNGLADVKAGQVVRVTQILGSDAARVVADNGDSWAEIGIDGKRAEWVHDEIAPPSTYNRARAICSCRHHTFPCEKCEMLKDTARQHTPEPSAFVPLPCYIATAGEHLADWAVSVPKIGPKNDGRVRQCVETGVWLQDHAARIAAAVNACAGMTDPAAEIAALRACALRLADYVEWHKDAIPSSERDDYEREYLIEGSESLIALAGKGDK